MDLAVEGRHALLFDDDSGAAFVNSRDALVPWSGDPALLIDRYDVRHLLDRIPARPPKRTVTRLPEEMLDGGITAVQLDHERYLDLPPTVGDADEEAAASDSVARGTLSETTKVSDATYQAVPFSYGSTKIAADLKNSDSGQNCSGYRPPFPLPERLLQNLPDTERLHQIIARTAMFVSQHGGQSEIVLRVKQGDNPTFGFLMPNHHLHEYFRFLVEHPQLLRDDATDGKSHDEEKLEKLNGKIVAAGSEALSLLGSVYGSVEDDDGSHHAYSKVVGSGNHKIADITPVPNSLEKTSKALEGKGEMKSSDSSFVDKDKTISMKKKLPKKSNLASSSYSRSAKDGSASLPGSVEQQHSSQSGVSGKPVLLEPPSFLKRMIEKILEFITRNGKEFEGVLIEQDKTVGRFPFLLPSNQYHPYYLAALEGACQGNGGSKRKWQAESTKELARDCNSSDVSEGGWLYDPHKKEKFKMIIGGSKKEKHDEQTAVSTRSGVSVDEAAAIVMAATRGVSPANAHQLASLPETTADRTLYSVRSLSSQRQNSLSKPTSSNEAGSLPLSGQQSNKRSSSTVDDVWIAKAIAKTAALVASSEADSSEASLTKEQKLKAERLKRARMFSAMIKTGGASSKMTSVATTQISSLDMPTAGSSRSGPGSDLMAEEREGSSVPSDAQVSARMKSREGDSDHDASREYNYGEKHHSSAHRLDEDTDGSHKQSKKRHRSEHSVGLISGDQKYRKHHSSSKEMESRRRHRHHSSSEDEYRHRKRSHRCRRNEETSEDECKERKLSDVRRKKHHHSRSQRKLDAEGIINDIKSEQSKGAQKVNMPATSDAQPVNATTEVPKDLREKIRAMLLETM